MLLNTCTCKKVTGWVVIFFINALLACTVKPTTEDRLAFQQKIDSVTSVAIDSAYLAISQRCDSLTAVVIPKLVDSLLNTDTLNLKLVADKQ